jgi:hypothetical protein
MGETHGRNTWKKHRFGFRRLHIAIGVLRIFLVIDQLDQERRKMIFRAERLRVLFGARAKVWGAKHIYYLYDEEIIFATRRCASYSFHALTL